MNIRITILTPNQRTSKKDTHRLWLDSYYQDITPDDLVKLKRAVDEALKGKP